MTSARMRVLHVIQNLDPDFGGPPMVAASIASAQAALGHDVSIAAYVRPGREHAVQAMLGKVPGIDATRFAKAAEAARDGCPVSTALQGNVELELDARLA